MTAPDHDYLTIRCARVESMPEAPVPSLRMQCEVCGRDIWVSHQTIDLVRQHHPGEEIHTSCMQCPGDSTHTVEHLPEQVIDLRAHGVPDPVIAGTLAVAEVADGLTLDDAVKDMIMNPRGRRALAYGEAYTRAKAFVRGVPW